MVEGGDAQHQEHVTLTLEHGGGGGKQLTHTYQRRKVRMKDGVSRDKLLQLGGSSDNNLGSPGSNKFRK